MRKRLPLFQLALAGTGLVLVLTGSERARGASSSSASADATSQIISSITLTKVSNLEFGRIVKQGTAQTATVAAGGTRTCSVTANCANGVTVTAAVFTVSGESGFTYAISGVPSSISITSGGNSMTVNTFTTATANGTTLTSGSDTLRIGATLNVGANQASGDYTLSNGVTVTVTYN